MWFAFLLLLWPGPVIPNQKTGSCSHPQPLCCLGADHRCQRGSCYCDKFCLVVSDCCPDHRTLCSPASHTPKMVLQMLLRMESPLDSARNHQDLVQTTVLQFLHTVFGRPLSVTVKGIRKKA